MAVAGSDMVTKQYSNGAVEPGVTTTVFACGHAVSNSYGHSCCRTALSLDRYEAPGIAPPDGRWDDKQRRWAVPCYLLLFLT